MKKPLVLPLLAAAVLAPSLAAGQAGVDPNTPNPCNLITPGQYKAILGFKPTHYTLNADHAGSFDAQCAPTWGAGRSKSEPAYKKLGSGASFYVQPRSTDYYYGRFFAQTKKDGRLSKVPGLGRWAHVQRQENGASFGGQWNAWAVTRSGWELAFVGDLKLTKAQMIGLLRAAYRKAANTQSNLAGPLCHQSDEQPGCKQPEFGANLGVDGASSPADAGSQPAVPDNSGVPPDQQPQDPTNPPVG